MNPEAVIDWWYGPARHNPARLGSRMPFWFSADDAVDAQISQRFAGAVEEASRGHLNDWASEPASRLALILLLDQFRRNLYRGTAAAFACDDMALRLCHDGIEQGLDGHLSAAERLFFYMPLQHSESEAVQCQAVEQFDALASHAPEEAGEAFRNCANYARLHRDIIIEFGRFPHRNAVLGRQSTAAETAYLKDGPTFGQE